jgi:hypothetical protein
VSTQVINELARQMGGAKAGAAVSPHQVAAEFKDHYRVGKESVGGDIPPRVLLKLGAHAGLLLLRILKPALEAKLPGFLNRALTPVFAVGRALMGFFYLFAVTRWMPVVRNALRAASLVLLAVGLIFPGTWIQVHPGALPTISQLWAIVFVGAPVLYLTLEAIFTLGPKLRQVAWLAALAAGGWLAWSLNEGAYDWLLPAWQAFADRAEPQPLAPLAGPAALAGVAVLLWALGRTSNGKENKV